MKNQTKPHPRPKAQSAKPKRQKMGEGKKESSRQIIEDRQTDEISRGMVQRFRMILGKQPYGILVVNNDGRAEFANQAFCDFLSLNEQPEALVGLTSEQVIQKILPVYADPDAALARIKDVVARGEAIFNNESWLRNGRVLLMDFEPIIVDGKDTGRMWISRDITDSNRAEERIKTILRTALDGFYMINAEGRILEANDSYCSMIGYSRAELLQMSVKDVEAVETEEVIKKRIQRIIENGLERFETKHRRKNGSVFTIEASVKYLNDGSGNLVVFMRDVTEPRQAQEELRESEEKFRNLFNNSEVGMFRTRLDGSKILDCNEKYLEILGCTFDEIKDKPSVDLWADKQERDLLVKILKADGHVTNFEFNVLNKQGEVRRCITSLRLYPDTGVLEGSIQDITERQQIEQALMESEERFRVIFEKANDGICISNENDELLSVNQRFCEMMGYSREELLKLRVSDLQAPEIRRSGGVLKYELERYGTNLFEGLNLHRSGHRIPVEISLGRIQLPSGGLYVSVIRDITERKRAEQALQETEERFRILFEYSPDGIVLIDPYHATTSWAIIDCNDNFCQMNGYSKEELIGQPIDIVNTEGFDDGNRATHLEYLRRRYLQIETMHRRKDGTIFPIEYVSTVVTLGGREFVLGIDRDATQRKQAEEKLIASEARLRTLFRAMADVVLIIDQNGFYCEVGPTSPAVWYINPEELLGKSLQDFFPPEQAEYFKKVIRQVLDTKQARQIEYELIFDNQSVWYQATISALDEDKTLWIAHDATNRKQSEKAIHQHMLELETLYESGLVLGQLLSPKEIAQKLIDLMGAKLDWHHTTIRLYHAEDETLELLAFNIPAVMSKAEARITEERFKSLITKAGDGLSGWTVQHRQTVRVGELGRDSRYVEIQPGLHSGMYVPLKAGERVVGVISIENELPNAFSEDNERFVVTLANQAAIALENSRLHEETLRQVKRLESLHTIDQNIAGSFDQRLTLEILLTHTIDQLGVDAAVIFTLQPYQRTLQYAVGKGFRTHIIENANFRLGESLAGRAVMERRTIHINDQESKEPNPVLAKLWLEEEFKGMDAVSLISKGQVKGLLSVYHRKAFTPNPAWSSFLETLAGQAAIAIDSTQLFNSLQQANLELSVAYDATIEGWSRAMDLRDKETEGHTERVTEMSMQLGKAMELGEEYLVHLRRGALLHDIGKLGVPDNILLKAEKLTDEEWEIMKKHPQLAYDMLYSVAYLHRALDIPYCHHERWDGTGYPRGLKGEQIPLAARIFAIVDVWDALTSDRPYRKAWSKPDALKYIREQSGKQFDPEVANIFLKEFGRE
ncbi:MAG: PAS domain S-box protein [Anaerolineales bacterium]